MTIKEMNRYDRKMINEKLKKEFRRYSEEFTRLSNAALANYKMEMKPGQIAPEKVPLSGEYADTFSDVVESIKSNVRSIIDPVYKDLEDSLTEAPSQDAVNTITLLSTRKNIGADEIYHMVDKYGDNVQAYNSIKDIANEHEIFIGDHPVWRDLQGVEGINRTVSKFSLFDANSGGATNGKIAFLEMSIDSVFPADE